MNCPEESLKQDNIYKKLEVFFDGECPVCSREIAFYRRCRGSSNIKWIDLRKHPENDIVPGLSRSMALERFTVITSDGSLLSGSQAFIEVWRHLSLFWLLGKVFSIYPLNLLLEIIYKFYLKIRKKPKSL